MLARVKAKRNEFSLRTEPSANRRYSKLAPQQSQLYAACAAEYWTKLKVESKPTLTAALRPRLLGLPYPDKIRNWLNWFGPGMGFEVNISPGTRRKAWLPPRKKSPK